MAFCRQMQDDVRLEVGQRRLHRRRVGDIRPNELKMRMILHRHERIEIARIGELIDDKDMMVGGGDGMPHEGGADEPCPTRHQKASSHQRSTYTKQLQLAVRRVLNFVAMDALYRCSRWLAFGMRGRNLAATW
jgi:hypothetical protein